MKIDYTHITPHQSSREGARIHLLVLHTTEGSGSLAQLGEIFDGEEASAHLGVDIEGRIGRYVEDSQKAWAVCNYNSVALNLEQIAFASTDLHTWFEKHHKQLEGAAKFLQYGHEHYGVPIRQGKVLGGGIERDGVVQHKDLGIIGCGHTDCGPDYPQDYVMKLARYYVAYHNDKKSKTTRKLAKQVNRTRKRYGIAPVR
jgi:hypothetical protein